MSEQLKPGEYRGKDGRLHRYTPGADDFTHQTHHPESPTGPWWADGINLEDIEEAVVALNAAAKAALEALEDEGEWVELERPDPGCSYIRVSKDGSRVQECNKGSWADYDAWWVKSAYRAGLAQGRKQLDADVRELVEAIQGLYWTSCFGPDRSDARVEKAGLQRAAGLAAKVRGEG